MKKIFNIAMLLAAALAFTGCAGEEDDLFDQSAAERLNAAKVRFTDLFSSSEAGWAMEYYPSMETYTPSDDYNIKSLGYLMLVDFDKDGSVKVGMNNRVTDNVYEEATSLWEVIADNGPVLTFSTYNENLHFFSDPAIFETGLGLEGDYEFVIVDAKADNDYAMLKGKKRGTYNLLTKLPAGTDFKAYFEDINSFQKTFASDTVNYAVMEFGESLSQVRGLDTGMLNIYPYGKDQIAYESYYPFLIKKQNDKYVLRFRDEIREGVQAFVYDEANMRFVCTDEGKEDVVLRGEYPSKYVGLAFANGHKWRLRTTNSMSDSFKSQWDKVVKAFTDNKFTLSSTDFSIVDGDLVYTMSYRAGKSNSTARFIFDYEVSADGKTISLSYREPIGNAANTYNALPDLQELFRMMSTSYAAAPATSAFNLNTVKMVSASDSNIWYNVEFIN